MNDALYSPPNLDLLCADQLPVIEFPRDKLHFVERLGEGQFGEVGLQTNPLFTISVNVLNLNTTFFPHFLSACAS